MPTINDRRELARLRRRNQRLMAGGFASAEDAVGWLGGVQSQDYAMSKWSLAKRVPGLLDGDVDAALAAGTILRTHILRPTWHFVLPADLRPIMALTAPRIVSRNRPPPGTPGRERRTIDRGLDVVRASLSGGHRLNRLELAANMVERGIAAATADTVPIFMAAELELVIVSGGLVGKAQTYALVDEVVAADAVPFDRDRALGELVRRFFTSHGPGTVADFTWWSSLTVADTRRGIEIAGLAGAPLETLDVEGTTYWWSGDTSDQAGRDDPSPTVHLMQAYDEYIVAYRAPRTVINLSGAAPASGLNRPPMLHAVVLDGQLAGWWRRELKGGRAIVEVELFNSLSRPEWIALEAAAERYGRFAGVPVSVRDVSA